MSPLVKHKIPYLGLEGMEAIWACSDLKRAARDAQGPVSYRIVLDPGVLIATIISPQGTPLTGLANPRPLMAFDNGFEG